MNTATIAFRVGHPAYQGANAMKWHSTYAGARNDLLARRVSMSDAHKALKQAAAGRLATTVRMVGPKKDVRILVCEVIADRA